MQLQLLPTMKFPTSLHYKDLIQYLNNAHKLHLSSMKAKTSFYFEMTYDWQHVIQLQCDNFEITHIWSYDCFK